MKKAILCSFGILALTCVSIDNKISYLAVKLLTDRNEQSSIFEILEVYLENILLQPLFYSHDF
ncbi:hypothetical protein DHD05_04520 [Arenibacter sp. N53]|nr:hypothetical protein [Arenibacter sp. N53]